MPSVRNTSLSKVLHLKLLNSSCELYPTVYEVYEWTAKLPNIFQVFACFTDHLRVCGIHPITINGILSCFELATF